MNKNKSDKINLIYERNKTIFILGCIAILSLLFYVYSLNTRINKMLAVEKQKTESIITPLQLNPAFNIDSLNMLTYWQKDIVRSAKLTTELKGRIIKIDTNGQVKEHGWPSFDYALKIRIQAKNGDENDIFISKDELKNTTFQTTTGQKIDSNNLKLNDEIKVTLTFDLTKKFNDNFVSAEVIKI